MIDSDLLPSGTSKSSKPSLILLGIALVGIAWFVVGTAGGTGDPVRYAGGNAAREADHIRRLVEWRDGMADVTAHVENEGVVVRVLRGNGPRKEWVETNQFRIAIPGALKVRELRTDATESGRVFAAIDVLTATESQILVVSLLPWPRRVRWGIADSGEVMVRGPRSQRLLAFSFIAGNGLNLIAGEPPRLKDEHAKRDGDLPPLRVNGKYAFDPCPWPVQTMYTGPFDIDL